jgi:hypothetical protein
MVAGVVRHAGAGQVTARVDEAVDLALRVFLPSDIERTELREELQLAIGKMVVDPPRHCLPRGALQQSIGEPGDDNAGHGAHAPARIAAVPDMTAIIAFVRRTILVMRIPIGVHRGRTVSGPDRQPSECRLQRFEKILAQAFSCGDGQIRVGREVGDAVQVRDVAVQKVAHEKRAR